MTIIGITGANGYIGTYLIRALSNSPAIQIKAFAHNKKPSDILAPKVQYIYGDIRDEKKQNEFLENVDVIVHLAAKLGQGTWKDFESINIRATENLLIKSETYKVKRFIYISTIEVYGFFKKILINENESIQPCGHFYSDSKIKAEQLVRDICSSKQIEWIILRPGMVFGEGSIFWYERLHKQALASSIPIVHGGKGLVYPINVQDLVLFIQKLTSDSLIKDQIYNVCLPEKVTWKDVVDHYSRVLGIETGKEIPAWKIFFRSVMRSIKQRSKSKEYEVYTRKSTIQSDKITNSLGCLYKFDFYQTMEHGREWLISKKEDL